MPGPTHELSHIRAMFPEKSIYKQHLTLLSTSFISALKEYSSLAQCLFLSYSASCAAGSGDHFPAVST